MNLSFNEAVSQLPVVQFEHVRTFFDCTQSQESKSVVLRIQIQIKTNKT